MLPMRRISHIFSTHRQVRRIRYIVYLPIFFFFFLSSYFVFLQSFYTTLYGVRAVVTIYCFRRHLPNYSVFFFFLTIESILYVNIQGNVSLKNEYVLLPTRRKCRILHTTTSSLIIAQISNFILKSNQQKTSFCALHTADDE